MKDYIDVYSDSSFISIDDVKDMLEIDDYFYINYLKSRKLFLTGDIDETTVPMVIRHILDFNKADMGMKPESRKPIYLYIDSTGGYVDWGMSLIDIIQASKTPVYTINLSCWYSMAFFIGIAGHKRFATKNAVFLLHDGSNAICDSASKAQDAMKFRSKLDIKLRDLTVAKTGITKQVFAKKSRDEWYFFADEALELNVIDGIIGEGDVSIDDII